MPTKTKTSSKRNAAARSSLARGSDSSPHVWIVEMLHAGLSEWHSTVGCKLTKQDGLREMRDWRDRNPNDRFRLKRYAAS